MNRKEMLDHITEQDKEIFSLIAKITKILKSHSLWGSDDEYVFEDGEIWYRFDPDYELNRTNKDTLTITKEEGNE